jgi:hypothetical protein
MAGQRPALAVLLRPDITSTRLIAPSFAPIETTWLAPVPEQGLSVQRAQGSLYRGVMVKLTPHLQLIVTKSNLMPFEFKRHVCSRSTVWKHAHVNKKQRRRKQWLTLLGSRR